MFNIDGKKRKWILLRRELHKNAEIGFDLPKTRKIIKDRLSSLKLNYQENKGGIIGVLGPENAKETILIRADMDALPMKEESELEFASQSDYAHCCGHDIHTTILLATLETITQNIDSLNKRILFLFQSNEEGGKGAKEALESSVFKKEKPTSAIALHVDAKEPLGDINYGYGKTFASNDSFTIMIKGISGHGARSFEAKDSLNGGIQIYQGLKSMVQNELNVFEHNIFTITSLNTKESFNIIPEKTMVNGSLRTYNDSQREYILNRIEDIVYFYGKALELSTRIEYKTSIPSLKTDREYTNDILDKIKSLGSARIRVKEPVIKLGSEDFAYISRKFPKCAYIFIGAGPSTNQGYHVGQHNTKVIFNEEAILIGTKCLLQVVFN